MAFGSCAKSRQSYQRKSNLQENCSVTLETTKRTGWYKTGAMWILKIVEKKK